MVRSGSHLHHVTQTLDIVLNRAPPQSQHVSGTQNKIIHSCALQTFYPSPPRTKKVKFLSHLPHPTPPVAPPPFTMPPYTLTDHAQAVHSLSQDVKAFHNTRTPFRINHGHTHATRTRAPSTPQLHIGHLNHVLAIDPMGKHTIAEPNVRLDALFDATFPHALMPPTVLEFPGITVGGAFSGASGESMSWEEGLFDACVLEVEMILGNGEVVRAVKGGENADLFDAARCSLGTLGVVTLLKVRLREAKDSVLVTYEKTDGVREMVDRVGELCEGEERGLDYIDGVLYSANKGVIVTARQIDSQSAEARRYPTQRFDRVFDEWFFRHARAVASGHREVVPLRSYLFRYDRGAFWGGETMLGYFGVPSNRFTRALFDRFCTSGAIYKAQMATGSAEFAIIQDLLLPVETSKEWVDFVDDELGTWPLWCAPVRKLANDGEIWGHPFWKTKPGESDAGQPGKMGRLFLNWGVWGPCDGDPEVFNRVNRRLEERLKELRGMKVIYAAAFYTEAEFWDLYDREQYESARKKWHAETLPTVWDKINRNPSRKKVETIQERPPTLFERLLNVWPLGGLYQLYSIVFR